MKRPIRVALKALASLSLLGALAYDLYKGDPLASVVILGAFFYLLLLALWRTEITSNLSNRAQAVLFFSLLVILPGACSLIAATTSYPRHCFTSYGKAHALCSLENALFGLGGQPTVVAFYGLWTVVFASMLGLIAIKSRGRP
jgi:hypothetical protein